MEGHSEVGGEVYGGVRMSWKRAVLELATIVAGVLIALAADDWRDSLRDRAEGEGYRARLEDALGSDLQEYAEAAASAAAVDSAAVAVLAVYRGRDVAESSGDEFVGAVQRGAIYRERLPERGRAALQALSAGR